jgi:hypothetical protein
MKNYGQLKNFFAVIHPCINDKNFFPQRKKFQEIFYEPTSCSKEKVLIKFSSRNNGKKP